MNIRNIKDINLKKYFDDLDLYAAILILVFGVILLAVGLLKNISTLKQVPIILLLSSMIYLVFRGRFVESKGSLTSKFKPSKNLFLTITSTFFILFSLCLLFISDTVYYRPLYFVVLLCIMGGLIASQIFLTDEKKYYYLILLEIIIFGILIRGSIFYQYPSVVGGDPWVHLASIITIIDIGHVTKDVTNYYAFPFMHLFVTALEFITRMGVKNSMFFISVSEVLVSVFFFLFITKIFNEKIGLLSALMLVVSTHFIQYGFIIIPQTIGLVFMGIIIFLLFYRQTIDDTYKKIIYGLLIFMFMFSILFSHTLTSFAMLLILISIFLVELLVNRIKFFSKYLNETFLISLTLVSFFAVALIYYWMYQAGMMGYVAESLHWGLSVSYQAPSESTLKESFFISIMKMLPLYVAIFLGLIGFLYSLNSKYFKSINLYGWLLILFIFGAVVLGLSTFLPARWFVFLEMTLIVPMAIGILSISRISPRKVLTLFLIVTFSSIIFMTSYEATAQNVNPYTPYPTQAMKESETVAMNTLYGKIPSNLLALDLGYHFIGRDPNIIDASDILSGQKNLTGLLLFRKEIINNYYLTSSLGGGHYSIAPFDPKVLTTLDNKSIIYDSESVTGYYGGL